MTIEEALDKIETEMVKHMYSQVWYDHLEELLEEIRDDLKRDAFNAPSR